MTTDVTEKVEDDTVMQQDDDTKDSMSMGGAATPGDMLAGLAQPTGMPPVSMPGIMPPFPHSMPGTCLA